MIYVAWILSLTVPFIFGYHFRDLRDKVDLLLETARSRTKKSALREEPKSELIDPADPVQTAIYEHEKLMKRLNPDE